MSIENDGTKVPFLQAQDKPKYDFEVLYKDKYFLGWEYQMSWTDTREGDHALSCNIVDGFHNSDPTLRFTIRPVRSKQSNR